MENKITISAPITINILNAILPIAFHVEEESVFSSSVVIWEERSGVVLVMAVLPIWFPSYIKMISPKTNSNADAEDTATTEEENGMMIIIFNEE